MPYQQGNKRIHTEGAKTSKTPALRVHVPTYMFYKSTTTMYTANVYSELQWVTVFMGKLVNVTITPHNLCRNTCILLGSSVTGNACNSYEENIYSVEAYERRTVFFNHLFPTTVNSCQDRQLPILIAPVHKDTF